MFGNSYRTYPRVCRLMRRWTPLAGAVALGLALLLLPGPVGASSSLPGYDSGAVRMTVPSAAPVFDLSQDANSTLGATLALAQIVELHEVANDSSTGPQVVAAAFPTDVQTYNFSSASTGGYTLVLTANLSVFHDSGLLFPPDHAAAPRPGLRISSTTLQVTVSSTSHDDRVLVQTEIQGWPWVSSSDLLAIGWNFAVPGSAGFAACAAVPAAGAVPTTACGASPFANGSSVWGSSISAVEGVGTSGPVAQLSWTDSVSHAPLPAGVGASESSDGSANVVTAEPSSSGGSALFAMDYALIVPAIPAPLTLHGRLVPYAAGLLVAGLAGTAGYVAWRRRERQALEELDRPSNP